MLNQARGNCLEDGGQNLTDALSQAEQRALDVLVVVLKQLVQLIEEPDVLLHRQNPPEIEVEQ